MEQIVKTMSLKEQLSDQFQRHRDIIGRNDTPLIAQAREQAFHRFMEQGFPSDHLERWRNTDLKRTLSLDYDQDIVAPALNTEVSNLLRCNIPHFDTFLVSLYNGWYISENGSWITRPDGIVIGSLAQAIKHFSTLVEESFARIGQATRNGLEALNNAFAQDGIFIYVPDHVSADQTIQIVSMVDHDRNLLLQNRNLIIMGKNSRLKLVHCDDSLNQQPSFTNTITEILLGEGAVIDHYKLQNINDNSSVISTTLFHQEANSQLSTHVTVLNGGLIRNDIYVDMEGENCTSDICGLYLVDKNQHVDNQVQVNHLKPYGTSNQLFKGIIDDHARAVFNGHVHVHRNAQKTNAYQSNKNILLTDKATVNTKPFLEIYADDVKCSHGATVGQLDQEALFYIRSRGISYDNARLLLMYAFAAEVINKITIEPLRLRMDDLVKKRLRGELSICDQCVLHCRTKENTVSFDIDMSKI
ncbi:MAG TPA: Fe-S cluster assembly protein SufD [Bacteroidales bacterium]|nr:Fe-S cluster assembly protein SufD [Bacteroidales bacterium]